MEFFNGLCAVQGCTAIFNILLAPNGKALTEYGYQP